MYVFASSTGSHVFFPHHHYAIPFNYHSVSTLRVTPPHPRKDVLVVFKASSGCFPLKSSLALYMNLQGTLRLTLPVSMNKPIKRIFMFTCAAECQKIGWNIWRRRVPPLLLSTMLLLVPVQEIRIPVLTKSSAQLYIWLFSVSKVVSTQQKRA